MNTLLESLADAQIKRSSESESANKVNIMRAAKNIIDLKWEKIKELKE